MMHAVRDVTWRKRALRADYLAARARMTVGERTVSDQARTTALLAAPELTGVSVLAAYVSIGREPGTSALLESLRDRGAVVLLPVLRPDGDLDWAAYSGRDRLVTGWQGLRTPAGERLGVDAVAQAQVVLAPALAVDRTGLRLGRGGGSYDRALARVGDHAFTCALVYDGEIIDDLPAESHDRHVQAAATPSGLVRFA